MTIDKWLRYSSFDLWKTEEKQKTSYRSFQKRRFKNLKTTRDIEMSTLTLRLDVKGWRFCGYFVEKMRSNLNPFHNTGSILIIIILFIIIQASI